MQTDALINLLGNLSAVGFVCFLAHRLTTKTIPDMADRFAESAKQQREDFRATLDKQRQDFVQFHNRENAAHEARLQSVMERCLVRSGDMQ